MSGWFGTSNRDTNNALDGIRAGHARRRNMQRQRYDSGLFGRSLGSHAEGHEGAHNETYRGFSLTFIFEGQFSTHITKAWSPNKTFSATGRSRGEASNKVKQKIDEFLGPGDGIPNGGNNGGNNEFTPVAMPNNYVNGGYQVIAIYNGMMQKYQVMVYTPGGSVGESIYFAKTEGVAASAKHAEFVALVDQKVAYEAQIPLTTDKSPYTIKLTIVGETALSGFFSGLFGLGNWAATPTRSFNVVVEKLDVDGFIEKYRSGLFLDYAAAEAEFDNQVTLVENNFYADPLEPEVPPNAGEGGDITDDDEDDGGSGSNNPQTFSYTHPGISSSDIGVSIWQIVPTLTVDGWTFTASSGDWEFPLNANRTYFSADAARVGAEAMIDASIAAVVVPDGGNGGNGVSTSDVTQYTSPNDVLEGFNTGAIGYMDALNTLVNQFDLTEAQAIVFLAEATSTDGDYFRETGTDVRPQAVQPQAVLVSTGETQTTTRSSGGHNHITADIGLTLAAIGLVGMVYLAVKDE